MNSPKPQQNKIDLSTPYLTVERLWIILKSTAPFMSTDEAMPFLCAVKLEATGTRLVAVATDRFTLGAHATEFVSEPFGVIIPADQVRVLITMLSAERLRGGVKGWNEVSLSLTRHKTPRLRVEFGDTIYTAPLYAGDFPKWRMLLPQPGDEGELTEVFTADPRKLVKIAKVPHDGHTPVWHQRGPHKPLTVRIGDFIGIVMPMRLQEHEAWSLPEWALT